MSRASASASAFIPRPINQPLRRIIVGTDFSDASAAALSLATDVAATHDAELVIVNAIDPMIATLEVPVQALVDDVRAGLDQAVAAAKARSVRASSHQEFGKPWWVINELASTRDADLVVVATHGRSAARSRLLEGLARLGLGSTADRVVRTCRVPVLTVPADNAASASQWKVCVVGVDFSEESALAAARAVQLLTGSRRQSAAATLLLFHTVALTIDLGAMGASGSPAPAQPMPEHWDTAEADARARLEQWAAALRSERLKVECATFRGYAPDGIVQAAQARHADAIALGTHGLGAMNQMLLGSVAQRVLHHAGMPVLTVRHPDRK